MIMKRSSGEMENITSMAKCLMMLSRGADSDPELIFNPSSKTAVLGRVFECKTCNRQFSSFQALGGHRASHKKPKLMEGDAHNQSRLQAISLAIKPKTHECSICGLEFAIGQALGGHMRRHRATLSGDNHHHQQVLSTSPTTTSSSSSGHHQQVPVLKRSTSRRVLCLDLNLTPLENDLELPIGTGFPEKNSRPPMIHCFI